MTERSDFGKSKKPQPKPFQVSLDLQTGMKIGIGIAAAQVIFGVVQMLITFLVGMYYS